MLLGHKKPISHREFQELKGAINKNVTTIPKLFYLAGMHTFSFTYDYPNKSVCKHTLDGTFSREHGRRFSTSDFPGQGRCRGQSQLAWSCWSQLSWAREEKEIISSTGSAAF